MGSKVFSGEVWTNVHPRILRAIREANEEPVDGQVGRDSLTRRAEELVRRELSAPCAVLETVNGTAANVLAMKALLPSWGSVVCADVTHVNTYEDGAPEYNVGAKLLTIPSGDGKLRAGDLPAALRSFGGYGYRPALLVLTQPTEYGVLYSAQELRALTAAAHEHGMKVYLDGARLLYALTASGTDLREMIEAPEIDAFSLGGTKAGLMFGEMVVFRRPEDVPYPDCLQKQSMQHLDKSKFLGAQFCALLEDGLWRDVTLHANGMAKRLEAGLAEKGLAPAFPVDTNMVFVELGEEQYRRVREVFDVHGWVEGRRVVRFCMSHETSEEHLHQLLDLL